MVKRMSNCIALSQKGNYYITRSPHTSEPSQKSEWKDVRSHALGISEEKRVFWIRQDQFTYEHAEYMQKNDYCSYIEQPGIHEPQLLTEKL